MNIISLLLVTSLLGVNAQSIDKSNYEIISMRGEYQKVFKLENGNYEFRYYANPIHYFDGEKMIEITNSNINNIETSKQYIDSSFLAHNIDIKASTSNNKTISLYKEDKNYNEFLVSSNEYYIFPTYSNSINSNDGSYLLDKYNYSTLLNENIHYPLELVQEEIVSNSLSPLKDKYVTIGVNGYTDSSILLAGKDPFQTIGPNNSLINYQYRTIFELNLPAAIPASIVSATLSFMKNTTTTAVNRNPNIALSQITNDISYESIQGTTNLQTTTLGVGLGQDMGYNFDITSAVRNSISSEVSSSILLSLDGTSLSGYASFYSTESSTGTNPYFSIEVTDNYLGATLYGDAPEYVQFEYLNSNCLGYALCINMEIDIELEKYMNVTEHIINCVINTIEDHGFGIRQIESYDSDIYNDERRIAFRYNRNNHSYWHFVRQNSDGSWSGKDGDGAIANFDINITPEDNEPWRAYEDYLYNLPTYYFAIKEV